MITKEEETYLFEMLIKHKDIIREAIDALKNKEAQNNGN